MKKIIITITAIVSILLIGVAIPKLTVRDAVILTDEERSCVQAGVRQQLDHPLQRIALALGKSAVAEKRAGAVNVKPNTIIVESYTIFRIPLPATRFLNRFTQQVICDPAGISQNSSVANTNLPPLTDGTDVQGLGEFHDSPVENGVKEYQSERLGISFDYPSDYLLFEGKGEGVGGAEYYVITIAPDTTYLRGTISGVYRDSEWPPSTHLAFYHEPTLAVLNVVPLDYLEQWIRAKPQSNFVPSDPAQQGTLTPATVAGVPALTYRVRGLYDSDYIAFMYGEWVVLAAADEMGENTNRDFQTILSSIQLKNHTR